MNILDKTNFTSFTSFLKEPFSTKNLYNQTSLAIISGLALAALTIYRNELWNAINTSLNPLINETHWHRKLKSYDNKTIDPNVSLILNSFVIDGIGDLEHLVHCVRCLRKSPQTKDVELTIWLAIGDNVPEQAMQEKLKELTQFNCKAIYISPIQVRIVPNTITYTCNETGSYDTNESCTASTIVEKIKSQTKKPLIINVSHECQIPDLTLCNDGSIDEYGRKGITESGQETKYTNLDILRTGLRLNTFGIWISDDLVFSNKEFTLSENTRKIIFGKNLNNEEIDSWEIGHASLRENKAKLAWMDLRLSQVDPHKHCSLTFSPFKNEEAIKDEITALVQKHGFNRCIIVNREEKETVLLSSESEDIRTLRIVHPFIPENDLPTVLHLSSKGSLGGAGDTSIIRGLKGSYPVFIEHRSLTEDRWAQAANYVKEKRFIKLHDWLKASSKGQYEKLAGLLTPELLKEWKEFSNKAMKELDIAPWVQRYIKYCFFEKKNTED